MENFQEEEGEEVDLETLNLMEQQGKNKVALPANRVLKFYLENKVMVEI